MLYIGGGEAYDKIKDVNADIKVLLSIGCGNSKLQVSSNM